MAMAAPGQCFINFNNSGMLIVKGLHIEHTQTLFKVRLSAAVVCP